MTRRRSAHLVPRLVVAAGLAAVAVGPVSIDSVRAATDGGNAVDRWNEVGGDAAIAACLSPANDPLHEARMYAIAHVAVHDGLNALDRRFEPYAYDATAPDGASAEAAVAAAAHDALVAVLGDLPAELFPASCGAAGIALVHAAYTAALAAIPDGAAKDDGIATGAASAAAIVALRAGDRANDSPLVDFAYPQGSAPGEYRFTSPNTPFAFAPKWGAVTPFALKDSSQFASGPPYPLDSARYADDFNEVQRLGGVDSERTDEQTEIARFWLESSPLAWNRMARGIATARGLDLWDSARLYGLLNMGMTDGYIGTFQEKYDYNFWRPVTAIHLAAGDGNPLTAPDPGWQPLVQTPPIPDHDSGHSVEGGVAAQVMQRVFGTDRIELEVCSMTLPLASDRCTDTSPVTRSFSRLSAAAAENGESRVLVGFHFRHAVIDGIAHGTKIGSWTVSHFMKPVDE